MITRKKLLVGGICIIILILCIVGGNYLLSVQNYKKTVSDIKIGSVDLSKISDGTYTGSCDVVYVGATISVTVKDKKITNIVILNHKTERGKPAEVIVDNVVKAQTLQVDSISGATNSSKVILKAIENALNSPNKN